MKNTQLFLVALVALLFGVKATCAAGNAPQQSSTKRAWKEGQLIIKLADPVELPTVKTEKGREVDRGAWPSSLRALDNARRIASMRSLGPAGKINRKRAGGKPVPVPHGFYVITLEDTDADIELVSRQCGEMAGIEFAEPNYLLYPFYQPNDPYSASSNSWGQGFDDQWGLKLAQVPEAWDLVTENNETVVAIVDSGADLQHADLAANLWVNSGEIPLNGVDDDGNGFVDDVNGWDFLNNDANPTDDLGHGTIAAGVVAAVLDNGVGMAGIGRHTKIMPLKFLPPSGGGSTADAVEAIYYAADNGAHVINMSFGSPSASGTLEAAVNYAYTAGLVLFAAAGNDSADASRIYPASIRNVITVGASDHSDQLIDFSNFGIRVDVVAPGGDSGGTNRGDTVLSLRAAGTTMGIPLDAGYTRSRGTSFASPFAAGVAALMLTQRPALSSEEIRQILRVTADDVTGPGWDLQTAYGRVNACRALQRQSALATLLRSPGNHVYVSGSVTVTGDAYGAGFLSFSLEYGIGSCPSNWTHVASSTQPVSSGSLGVWDTRTTGDGEYTLRLRAADPYGASYEDRVVVVVNNYDPPLHAGWPKSYFVNAGDPVFADLNRDGAAEILWGEHTNIIAVGHDGKTFSGWPRSIPFQGASGLSVSDLDGDGDSEVVLLANNFSTRTNAVSIWHHDGRSLAGWPKIQVSGNAFLSTSETVALADIDADGFNDIVYLAGNKTLSANGVIHVCRQDGTPCAGWPVTLAGFSQGLYGSPAVGDLDGDGRLDIVVLTLKNVVCVYRHDGTQAAGWPVTLASGSTSSGGPGLADVDHDGALEVTVGVREGNVYVLESNGAVASGWPKDAGQIPRGPAFADLDGDGDLEIAFGSQDGLVSVWHHDGTVVSGWPQTLPSISFTPAIADVNGDGRLDLVVSDGAKTVNAWNWCGQPLYRAGFPIPVSESFGFNSATSVGDVDNDGLLELLVTGGQKVYLWDLSAPSNPTLQPFPKMRQSNARLARYAEAPVIRRGNPLYMAASAPRSVVVAGDHYLKGMKVFFGAQQQAVTSESATSIVVTTSVGMTPGWYDVTVYNVNSGSNTLNEAFVVVSGAGGDDDGDGLPNFWECQHALDPFDGGSASPDNGAQGDPDGDGYVNGQEWAAGTDPRDASSLLRMSLDVKTLGPTSVVLQWPSAAGRNYTVYRSSNLLQQAAAVTNSVSASPPMNTFTDSFFRGGPFFYFLKADFAP